MPEVVKFKRDQSYRNEIVAKLENLLEAAKAGEIISLVYACEQPGGEVTVGCTLIKDRYTMLGYLAFQMYRTAESIADDGVPSNLGGEQT